MAKLYRINRKAAPPVYKTSREEVRKWCGRNPGEMESYDTVNMLEELIRVADELAECQSQMAEAN